MDPGTLLFLGICLCAGLVLAFLAGRFSKEGETPAAIVFLVIGLVFLAGGGLALDKDARDSYGGRPMSVEKLPAEGAYQVLVQSPRDGQMVLTLVQDIKGEKTWTVRSSSPLPPCFFLKKGKPIQFPPEKKTSPAVPPPASPCSVTNSLIPSSRANYPQRDSPSFLFLLVD